MNNEAIFLANQARERIEAVGVAPRSGWDDLLEAARLVLEAWRVGSEHREQQRCLRRAMLQASEVDETNEIRFYVTKLLRSCPELRDHLCYAGPTSTTNPDAVEAVDALERLCGRYRSAEDKEQWQSAWSLGK
jgi:hypothetical protein